LLHYFNSIGTPEAGRKHSRLILFGRNSIRQRGATALRRS
jgi:hypothetical protein